MRSLAALGMTTLDRHRGGVLIALGLLSVALYLWTFAIVGQLDQRTPTLVGRLLPDGIGLPLPPVPTLPWLATLGEARRPAESALLFVLAISVLFVFYGLAIAAVARGAPRSGRRIVVAFALSFQVLALLAPNMLSSDAYAYALYGRILAVYGSNPYVDVPASYPDDPYAALIYWQDAPSFYGPLWTLLSAGLVYLAGDNVALGVTLFRGVAAASALAAMLLVGLILDRIDPSRAPAGLALLGWNPLLVVEAGLGGHNDVLMAALILAAFAGLVRGRWTLAVATLVLAGMVKLVALALLPLVGPYVLRRLPSTRARLGFVARAGAASLVVGAALVVPVWAGPATFAVGTLGIGGSRYVNGLGEVALQELRVLFGEERVDTQTPLLFTGWWVTTEGQAPLRAERGDAADVVRTVPGGAPLLVVAPPYGRWTRVYDPDTRRPGYVRSNAVAPAERRPPRYDDDPDLRARERGPLGSPALQRANAVVRTGSWALTGLVWAGALVAGTRTLPGLVRATTAVFLALFYLASAWFWPWYVVWGVAVAALAPSSALSLWTVLLSWGVLLVYATLGLGDSSLTFVYTYRSLAMFGLPLLAWAAVLAVGAARRRSGRGVAAWGAESRREPAAVG